jgi:hypothetical protein
MRQILSTLALGAPIATPAFAAEPPAQHPPALVQQAALDRQLAPGIPGVAPSSGDVSIPLLEAAATALAKGGLPDALKGNLHGSALPADRTHGDR